MTEREVPSLSLVEQREANERGVQIVGHPGVLENLPARELLVDKDYQRIVNNRRVEWIVVHFDRDVFGVLYANRRDSGHIYIIDGQHRWESVRRMHRDDWLIPTFVVDGLSKEDEARVFWKINQYRLHPGALDTFRARIQAGEQIAIAIQQLAWDTGIHLMAYPSSMGPTDVMAYGTLERIYNMGILPEVIGIIREGWAFENGAFRAAYMMGVARFVTTFDPLYNADVLRGVMAMHPPASIEARALFYKTTLSSSPPIAFARALHYFYNEHAPNTDKLPSWGDQDEFVAAAAQRAKVVRKEG